MRVDFMKNILVSLFAALSFACGVGAAGTSVPVVSIEPAGVETATADPMGANRQTAVFAGGCFWGVEAVFEHVKGVIDVKSGYAGGKKESASYDEVSTGTTGN